MLSRELQNRSGAGHIVMRQHRAALEKVRGELHYGEVCDARGATSPAIVHMRSSEVASGSLARAPNVFEETP